MILVSVIICTRNPREAYFKRVLATLAAQTAPAETWELIIVDNGSTSPVADRGFQLPANGRIVVEEQAGKTHALLAGIRESNGELVLVVDDDNVLAPDYLEQAIALAGEYPRIGVFGGRLLPEFESRPGDWMKPFWKNLALLDFDRDRWTNQRDFAVFPPGAGMCIRRSIADSYVSQLANDGLRKGLDRVGQLLGSGGDTDLVLQAIDAGWGVGQFTRLSLTHLIPRERLTIDYHTRLAEGISRSAGLLNAIRSTEKPNFLRHWIRGWLSILRTRGPARTIARAGARGWVAGLKEGWRQRGGRTR